MNVREFEGIKTKIETLKTKKAKAEGQMENILASWKETYKVSSLEEARTELSVMEETLEKGEREVSDLYETLTSLLDWSTV